MIMERMIAEDPSDSYNRGTPKAAISTSRLGTLRV